MFGLPAENFPAPMSPEAIPDYENVAPREVELELLQEGDALGAADVFPGVQPEE